MFRVYDFHTGETIAVRDTRSKADAIAAQRPQWETSSTTIPANLINY